MSKQQANSTSDQHHDQVFVVTFLGVLGVLVVIAIAIGVVANSVGIEEDGLNPVTLERTEQRLQPVGEVYTDASQVPAAPVPVASKQRSAEEIVQSVCAACHSSGLLGAPKTGDVAEWKKRQKAAGGLDGMVEVAIQGRGSMPPRGGDAALTDEQVRAAVELMIK